MPLCAGWETAKTAELSLSRSGGIRTHTPFQDPDSKSENRRPGVSYRILLCGLGKPKTRFRRAGRAPVSERVLFSIAAALLPP